MPARPCRNPIIPVSVSGVVCPKNRLPDAILKAPSLIINVAPPSLSLRRAFLAGLKQKFHRSMNWSSFPLNNSATPNSIVVLRIVPHAVLHSRHQRFVRHIHGLVDRQTRPCPRAAPRPAPVCLAQPATTPCFATFVLTSSNPSSRNRSATTPDVSSSRFDSSGLPMKIPPRFHQLRPHPSAALAICSVRLVEDSAEQSVGIEI